MNFQYKHDLNHIKHQKLPSIFQFNITKLINYLTLIKILLKIATVITL